MKHRQVTKRLRRLLSLVLILAMMTGLMPTGTVSFAVNVGNGIEVDTIEFVKNLTTAETLDGYIQITGSALSGETIWIDYGRQGYVEGGKDVGTKDIDNDGLVKISFTSEEIGDVTGVILIGTTTIDLGISSFPNITSLSRENLNQSLYDGDRTDNDDETELLIKGSNFDQIETPNSGTMKFQYGYSQWKDIDSTQAYVTIPDSSSYKLTEPPLPGRLGSQDLRIVKSETIGGIPTTVKYSYAKAFRIMEDLGLDNPTMTPNTGAKGDQIKIQDKNFTDTRDYAVYFLESVDGTDSFTDTNKGKVVSLDLAATDTELDTLYVTVPDSKDFELGSYYVVLTDTVDGEIVAEQYIVDDDGKLDQFTVIEATYQPSIANIQPEKGSDTGSTATIYGKHLLTLFYPDLEGDVKFAVNGTNPAGEDSEQTLHIVYDDTGLEYDGEAVTAERWISVIIGNQATFVKANGQYVVEQGSTDSFMIQTGTVDDADTDPKKDIVVEIKTILTEKSGGKTYSFDQKVTLADGYEYVPSTLTPEIESITPDTIQIEDTTVDDNGTTLPFYKFAEDTLFAIKGKHFLVEEQTDTGGNTYLKYPTVLFKENDDNTSNTHYQLGFFPNEVTTDSKGNTVRGVIKYMVDETGTKETILRDADGDPVEFKIAVVDANNKVVDGTENNEEGTKIIITSPDAALIETAGTKHVQVTNLRRDSDDYGAAAIFSDSVNFVETSDVPVIESVDPQITTVEGDIDVVVTGTNLQEGLKLYLDGEAIDTYTREVSSDGESIILTFKAPPGREGTTQLQIINPGGGLAVSTFTYITSFDADPVISDFNPKLGTTDTEVVIDGENFLKGDPTASSTDGYEGLRLIGTRVYLDGKDVNSYYYDNSGDIKFNDYTSPGTEALIYEDAGVATYSPFYQNSSVTVTSTTSNGAVYFLGVDEDSNPRITDNGSVWYDIRYNKGDKTFEAYDANNTLVGTANITFDSTTGITTIAITNGPTFEARMNNNILLEKLDASGASYADLADYAESVYLYVTEGTDKYYYTLRKNLNGDIRLSNGRDALYTIRWDDNQSKFIATRDSDDSEFVVTVESDGIYVGNTSDPNEKLMFATPYVYDTTTRQITGDRTNVVSTYQITFRVPKLNSGRGYKDVKVVNPDTMNDEKTDEEGFYYIPQPSSDPVITSIEPNKGSTDGGYVVKIKGSDFEDGVTVYIDGIKIEKEDTDVSVGGKEISVVVPKYKLDLAKTYNVSEVYVSVTVVNQDGGSYSLAEGFRYVIPASAPEIKTISPTSGNSSGGELVEIKGYDFRFYEPYVDSVGGSEYNEGDAFEDLNSNGKWDDLEDVNSETDKNGDGIVDSITLVEDSTTAYYNQYYQSKVLPKVYFGEDEAKIVEFSEGYLVVITPEHAEGTVNVKIVNNDSGISNEVTYTYSASKPTITSVSPNKGRKQGVEIKDVYGTGFTRSEVKGYLNDDENSIVTLTDVDALVRFADIDNLEVDRDDSNSGLIYSQKATVKLDGDLTASYDASNETLKLSVEENGAIYTRTFNNFKGEDTFFPMEMLKNGNIYYTPSGYSDSNGSAYTGKVFEYIRMYIKDKRLYVERGYAPTVDYDSASHLTISTPSYNTIGTVDLKVINPDGGSATIDFVYTNPASAPKILSVEANEISADKTHWMVQGAVNGTIEIEIIGTDFREGAVVHVDEYEAEVSEITTKTVNDVVYDLLIVSVPKGSESDVDKKYAIVVENTDGGLASSATISNLIGPNYNSETLPYYFIYREGLSGPEITSVTPKLTSVYGGHQVVLTGTDFRKGASVIIGTSGGVPITDVTISDDGTTATFTTPDDMTVGEKDIILQNSDYGQSTLDAGITIVSYPIIDDIDLADGNSFDWLTVEGGQSLKITGSGFQDGAKVYFGGTRSKYDETQTGAVGLWKDDVKYVLVDGVEASSVTFEDEKTLIVTTPKINSEDNIKITILNPDTGISDGDDTVKYSQPVPSDPTGLKVELINDRYIKLYEYTSNDVEYYDIYYYIGNKTVGKLVSGDYRDFSYLDSTDSEPYKITELPNFELLEKGGKLAFVIKAINKFGESDYSNIAYLKYTDLEDVEYIGPEDEDGGLGVPVDEEYLHIYQGNTSKLDLGTHDLPAKLEVDLTEYDMGARAVRQINVPAELVTSSGVVVYVNYGDYRMQFMPLNLNTDTFRQLNFYESTYAQIETQWLDDNYSSLLKGDIPRGQKAVGDVFKVDYHAINNSKSADIDAINGQMDIVLTYEAGRVGSSDESSIGLYRYDQNSATWVLHSTDKNEANNEVYARVGSSGYFILLADR